MIHSRKPKRESLLKILCDPFEVLSGEPLMRWLDGAALGLPIASPASALGGGGPGACEGRGCTRPLRRNAADDP